jgi:transposase
MLMSDRYPPEFRAQVVALYRDGISAKQLASEFGLSPTTVTNWTRRARLASGVDPVQEALSDKEEIARLKRLLQQRDEELETLGKALAFFVRRADQG